MKKTKISVILILVLSLLLASDCVALEKPYRCKTNLKMKIALTFDDGPHKRGTPPILDVLDRYNVKATFFVIGENVERNPDILIREINSGHEIGNHTFNHITINRSSVYRIKDQISKTEDVIYETTEYRTKVFRPPEGFYNNQLRRVAEDMDYNLILWQVDTHDWTGASKEKIIDKVLDCVKSGDIILMHDFIKGGGHTAEALEVLIPVLLARGYKFVTVSELIMSK